MEFMTCATEEGVAVHHREDDHYVSFPSLPTECAVNGAGAFNDVSRCPKIGILVIRLKNQVFRLFYSHNNRVNPKFIPPAAVMRAAG